MLVIAVLTCCFSSSSWSSGEQSVQGASLPWHFDGLSAFVTLLLAMPNSHLYMFRLESRSCELGRCDPGNFLAPNSSFFKCCSTFTEVIMTIRDGKQTQYLNQTQQTQYLNQTQQTQYLNQTQQTQYLNQTQQTQYLNQIKQTQYLNQTQQTQYLNQTQQTQYLNQTQETQYLNQTQQTQYLNQTQQTQYLNRSFVVTWFIFVLFSVPFCFRLIIIVYLSGCCLGKKGVAPKCAHALICHIKISIPFNLLCVSISPFCSVGLMCQRHISHLTPCSYFRRNMRAKWRK